MTPARAVVKLAQAKAEKAGYESAAEHFREDDKGFWEKRARKHLFDGKSKEAAAEELYRAATLQRGALDGTKHRTKTVILPTFLASALINGDVSGLEEEDNKYLLKALELAKGGHYVDVGQETWFAARNDVSNLGGDVAEFTIMFSE